MTPFTKNSLKKSLIHTLLAIVLFSVYYVAQDREGIRKYIGDVGYDATIKGFSFFNSDIPNDKEIVVLTIDNKHLTAHHLSDGNNALRYNYTPRFVIADILKELDETIHAHHLHYPKAVFIDYIFAYSGDIEGKITQDDQKLIDALTYYAQFYPIYLPTTQQGIFLEKLALHKNIHFVAANGLINSDDVQRGYQPYICQGTNVIPNVSIAITQNEIQQKEALVCPMAEMRDFNDYFRYRTLYKQMSYGRVSNWNNITTYSANDIGIIGQDLSHAIVLIGSDYQTSGDLHNTPVGQISGIFITANAIATRYYAHGYIRMLNPWMSIAIYFVLFFIMFFFMLQALDHEKKRLKTTVILMVMIGLFYAVSMVLFVYTKSWLNWVIPLVLNNLILLFEEYFPLMKKRWNRRNDKG